MAYEEALQNITLEANGDLSALQYRFVKHSGTNREVTATFGAQGEDGLLGVVQSKVDAQGKASTIAISGVTKVEASATIAAGANVTQTTDGRAVTAATTNNIWGIAIEGGAVGELIPVLLGYRGAVA